MFLYYYFIILNKILIPIGKLGSGGAKIVYLSKYIIKISVICIIFLLTVHGIGTLLIQVSLQTDSNSSMTDLGFISSAEAKSNTLDSPVDAPGPTSRSSRTNYFGNESTVYELETNSDIVIDGVDKWDSAGYSLASGDIDGDGKMDIIIGAYDASSGPNNERYSAGEIYVIFGDSRSSLPNSIDLASKADIVIYGNDESDFAGTSLASGDLNGDGKDEIIIGIPDGDGPSNTVGQEEMGEVVVIFGDSRFSLDSTMDLGKDFDLIIYGRSTKDFAGSSIAVGNIDNDSYEDLIIGAEHGDGATGKRVSSGDVYVFYGQKSFPNTLKCANADFAVYGSFFGDAMGESIAVGDINNDNHDDLLLGAPDSFSGSNRNRTFSGECYVVFGDSRANLGKSLDLENRTHADIIIYGNDEYDSAGTNVALADLDGDNYADIIIGAEKADGPNNARDNSGELYVIKGNKRSLMRTEIDLRDPSMYNLIIYGADPKDRAGFGLATGDLNGDGISDIIIGAALADGKQNNLPSAGEVHFIYGNISLEGSTERDLGATGSDLIIQSATPGAHAGFSVCSGDIDDDGKDDLFIGVPYANKDANITSSGKTYIVFGTDVLKRLKNIGLRVDGVPDRLSPVCYAEYKTYSFVVNVTDSIGITDVQSVSLILDPGGSNIELTWTEQTNSFSETKDPNNLVRLKSDSTHVKKITETLIEIRFEVIFNGNYPDEAFHEIIVLSTSDGGLKDKDTYKKMYKVENDLEFTGNLEVTGAYQGQLNSGSWIQSNESVMWTGLTVVYEGTKNTFPPDIYFEVIIENDNGNKWFNHSSSGKEFVIITIGNPTTDLSDFHTLTIISRHVAVNVPEPIQYELKIASPNIKYLSPTPDSSTWFKTNDIDCSITVTDLSGGDILGFSLQYAISKNGKNGYDLWQYAGEVTNAVSLKPEVKVTFDDGNDNYIKWRAKSTIGTLGDIYIGSVDYRVLIDTTPVFFTDSFPGEYQWQPRRQVTCGVTIKDNWTGVDALSIQYAYSTVGVSDLTRWTSPGVLTNAPEIKVEVPIYFEEGMNNYLIWRANDIIGNELVTSPVYFIKVSTQKPISTLFLPVDNSELSTTAPVLTWSGFDPNEDPIKYDVYLGTDEGSVANLDEFNLVATDHEENSLRTYGLLENVDYFWTVIPSDATDTGLCESGVWNFSITLEVPTPEVVLKHPLNNSITNRTTIDIVWFTDYIFDDALEYQIYLDTNPIPLKLYKKVKNVFSLTIEGLVENVKYYWTIVPLYNKIYGTCLTGIWSFKIDRTFNQNYDIFLDVNETGLVIPWKSSWEGIVEIMNNGNGVENVELTMYAGILDPMINLTTGTIILQPSDVLNFTINISIPDGFPVRSYNVVIQATSLESGEIETVVVIVQVIGTDEYYEGFEHYRPPSNTDPLDELIIPEDLPIKLRNILMIAFVMVLSIALTIILFIKLSLNKANERAIHKLKKMIVMKEIELEVSGKMKPEAKVTKTPTPVPQTPPAAKPSAVPIAKPATAKTEPVPTAVKAESKAADKNESKSKP